MSARTGPPSPAAVPGAGPARHQARCAVCRLKRDELLDAAHILPDRDERGRPEVPNGLSLCKIHHAAFDAHILGVAPDYVVHIRQDVLEEHDGPMLTHGLQEMDGQANPGAARRVAQAEVGVSGGAVREVSGGVGRLSLGTHQP